MSEIIIIIRSRGKGFLHFLQLKRKNVLPLNESKIIYKRTEPTSGDQDFIPSLFSKKKKTVRKNLMMGMYPIIVLCLVVEVVVQRLPRYILECPLSSCCHFLTVIMVDFMYFLINTLHCQQTWPHLRYTSRHLKSSSFPLLR